MRILKWGWLGVGLLMGCGKVTEGGLRTAGPVQVRKVEAIRMGEQVELAVRLGLRNERAGTWEVDDQTFALKAAGVAVPKFVKPFKASLALAPGAESEGEFTFWAKLPQLGQPLTVEWEGGGVTLRVEGGISSSQLPEGKMVVVSRP